MAKQSDITDKVSKLILDTKHANALTTTFQKSVMEIRSALLKDINPEHNFGYWWNHITHWAGKVVVGTVIGVIATPLAGYAFMAGDTWLDVAVRKEREEIGNMIWDHHTKVEDLCRALKSYSDNLEKYSKLSPDNDLLL